MGSRGVLSRGIPVLKHARKLKSPFSRPGGPSWFFLDSQPPVFLSFALKVLVLPQYEQDYEPTKKLRILAIGESNMASTMEIAFESSGYPSFGGRSFLGGSRNSAPEMPGVRGGGIWDHPLDRISSGICENAARLHRSEHRQYLNDHRQSVRRAATLRFLEKLADLKGQIRHQQATSESPVDTGRHGPPALVA